ncbi:polysulfide reductase [Cryptosporangium japonicum]|uniref:Polysulfide reductase NrfD n=1 Tax=Cryptosporangium japonicum TaxID=80872 RepID=A0ABN0UWM4_9ACTN
MAGEPSTVPSSYVHRSIRVTPVRQAPDIPAYLYFGGIAGASAGLAALAELTGERRLATASRFAAAGCALAAVAAAARDLRRPQRFLAGLRAPDPSFPLSLGTWLVVPFAGLATVTAGAELAGWRVAAAVTGAAAGVLGPAVCTYTAVALVDTEVPAWHEAYRELPFLFAGSGISGAAGIALIATLGGDPAPARRLAVAGAAMELAATARLRAAPGSAGVSFRGGTAGRLLTAAAALTTVGATVAALGGLAPRRETLKRLAIVSAGLALLASGALSRLSVHYAGQHSAEATRFGNVT